MRSWRVQLPDAGRQGLGSTPTRQHRTVGASRSTRTAAGEPNCSTRGIGIQRHQGLQRERWRGRCRALPGER
eukprot:13096362-Alexandrium_andersonii.AAC.1